jgi:CheY-like chemotaxis protein
MAADAKNPRRILVVDDEWLLATWLAEALEDVGYLVQTASDGQEALNYVSTFRPDLVITDFMMPRLTGLEFATALGSARPGQHPDHSRERRAGRNWPGATGPVRGRL